MAKANSDLTYLKKYYPDITTEENNHPFTECADHADHIKGLGYKAQADWHFVDQPYLDKGGDISDYNFTFGEVNLVEALTTCVLIVKGDTASIASDDAYYKQIQDWFSYEVDQVSFALRLIIHYVGDAHQPLHAVAEVDDDHPTGDRGGNDQWVPNKDGAGNLHAVWDSVLYEYTGYPNLPLSDSDWNHFTNVAADLASKYDTNYSDDIIKRGQF